MNLVDELNAEEGSFLLELRTGLNWNHDMFIELLRALNQEWKATKNNSYLNREIASGIWYITHFIKDWSEHKNFPDEYYQKCYELIDDLAYSYFTSESPYSSNKSIENKIDDLNTFK